MANVKNYFEQDNGDGENTLVIGGDIETGTSSASLKEVYVEATISDISGANTGWAVSPCAGTITKIYSVIDTAITVADAIVTCSIGAVAITGGAITVAFTGSAAGTVDTVTPTAANVVTAGAGIKAVSNGGSTDASKMRLIFVIKKS